ncbi:hypothetical protein AXI70_gp08 [Cronobacter phage Dev-CD-23823]|uniref:Uncharacterized protein n=1 Tax=Cronobacter phage Dev-CD-23823 TaxID=1712539 RepID=A0A0K8IWJ7_9CAUD|nr:hypothetical protein AXI70_gp08 [Cronobacter phage Dev-CD-23823]CUH74583.1 hypothetical protein [Cronobacter phage Dev-CD-23823]
MNPIVYSTDPALQPSKPSYEHRQSMKEWMNEVRVSPRKNRDAQNALNCEYRRRAAAVGLSFDEYLKRFNIKLK